MRARRIQPAYARQIQSDARFTRAPLIAEWLRLLLAVLLNARRAQSGKAVYRSMGSLAFVAAARAVYYVTRGTGESRERLVLPVKANLDLKREGPMITAECGAGLSKAILTVEGSVIGTVTPTAKMTLEETVKFKAVAGLQQPEHFEEGAKDTLVEKIAGVSENTTEQAGLTVTALDKSDEPMEIKTRVV